MAIGQGFIVCLYGLFDKKRRTTIEMIGYHQYLDRVARFIAEYPSRDKIVILAGGKTTPLDISEARSVLDGHFKEALKIAFEKWGFPRTTYCETFLEEASLNLAQNISFGAAQLVKHRMFSAIIIVDKPRRYTARKIAQHPQVMPQRQFEWDIASFPRRDIHPHSTLQYQLRRTFRYFLNEKLITDELAVVPDKRPPRPQKETRREPTRPRRGK